MAGFADIDPTSPLGADALSSGDNQIRDFKQDVLDGIDVEHDDGQATPGFQGLHKLTSSTQAALPGFAATPAGHVQFVNNQADQLLLKRNDGVAGYVQSAIGDRTRVGSKSVPVSIAVGAGLTVTTNIQPYSTTTHRRYLLDAFTAGVNNPIIRIGSDVAAGTDIYIYIQKNKLAGFDQVVVRNGTVNAEAVFVLVTEIIG